MTGDHRLWPKARVTALGVVLGVGMAFAGVAHAAGDAAASLSKPVNGNDPVREFSAGLIALQAGRFEDAAAKLQFTAQTSPDNPDVWRFLGAARAGLGDWAGSRLAYEAALKLAPDDVAVHAGLGVAFVALGDPKTQVQLDWIAERMKACGGHCPDADKIGSMFRTVTAVLSGQAPAPVL
jgi:cytochrome c-type biogenesis protein CcmH/NrfG